jgi:preprotein translocase subunit SecE
LAASNFDNLLYSRLPDNLLRGAFIHVAKSKSRAAVTSTGKEPNAVVRYFQETRAELRKVTWPTREEARNLTLIIVAVTIAMAVFLGLFDYLFQETVSGIILGQVVWFVIAVVLFLAGVAAFYYNSREE